MAENEDRDEAGGLILPRAHERLAGHGSSEGLFLDALRSGRLHHSWLISGPRGVGKATLAFRMARFLLKHGGGKPHADAGDLTIGESDGVFRRVAALSHPDFHLVEEGLRGR